MAGVAVVLLTTMTPAGDGAPAVGWSGVPAAHVVSAGAQPQNLASAARPARNPAPPPATLDVPTTGEDIGQVTRTCAMAIGRRTATSSSQCKAWRVTGPVNVVIVLQGRTGTQPPPVLGMVPRWQAARGNWLVASGYVESDDGRCAAGWHDSGAQIELRLTHTNRYHIKLITYPCASSRGERILFGDAHTDSFDLRRCGGDHMIDLDGARDAMVSSLRGVSGFVSVEYRPDQPAGSRYAGGCGGQVVTDGRVAYVTIRR